MTRAADMLSLQLDEAFDLLEQVIGDITQDQYAWQPPGTANAVSKLHVHTLTSVDVWANAMALRTPVLWPEVAKQTGLPGNALKIWGTESPIDLGAICQYGRSLRSTTVPAIAALTDAVLDEPRDLPFFGKRDVAYALRLAALQLATHTGEISAAKGLQGLTGLPY
jgi:hypothetical protein